MEASKIHKKLLCNAIPHIETLYEAQNDNISESDIVDSLQKSFQENRFRNLTDKREREGRSDYVIYEKNNPKIIYEIKTYFKSNERFDYSSAITEIEEDLLKLAKRKSNANGYFLLVCSKEMFEKCKMQCELEFITSLANQGTKYSVDTFLVYVTVLTKHREETDTFYMMSFLVEKL